MTALPDPLAIEPLGGPFEAAMTPPGSKSLTCRAYVLAALADGESRLHRPLRSDDTDHLLAALGTLGAASRWDGDDVVVDGVGGSFPRGGEVNLGDGGAPTRFTIAAACLAGAPIVVDGSPRMRERPVAELVDMLRALGARIDYLDGEGRVPVRVTPSDAFRGGRLEVSATSSSQFISALLLVAPHLPEGLRLAFTDEVTSASYVQLTAGMMNHWLAGDGLVREDGDLRGLAVRPSRVRARAYPIEPDASSAVYWMVAAALVPGARVEIAGLGMSMQPDVRVLEPLAEAGAAIDLGPNIAVRGPAELDAFRCDARLMPDASLALAALAARARGVSRITGLRTLRVKETDRIAALAAELRRIGCDVEADDDSIAVDPSGAHDRPVVIETYRDHRMAMAFAVLGLVRPGLSIRDPECVRKSYPGFWSDLGRLHDGGAGTSAG